MNCIPNETERRRHIFRSISGIFTQQVGVSEDELADHSNAPLRGFPFFIDDIDIAEIDYELTMVSVVGIASAIPDGVLTRCLARSSNTSLEDVIAELATLF